MLNLWENKLFRYKHVIEIYNEFKNIPEGHYSVVMENLRNGGLENLVTNVGAIPENLLIKLTWQMINAINLFQKKTNQAYNGLFPSQILFDDCENLKVIYKPFINIYLDYAWVETTASLIQYRQQKRE